MLQGYTRPKRADIFGPSATGGSMNDAGERQLYQHGEGIGSIFSSLFSKFLPAAARTVKNIAQSKIVRDTGKQILALLDGHGHTSKALHCISFRLQAFEDTLGGRRIHQDAFE